MKSPRDSKREWKKCVKALVANRYTGAKLDAMCDRMDKLAPSNGYAPRQKEPVGPVDGDMVFGPPFSEPTATGVSVAPGEP